MDSNCLIIAGEKSGEEHCLSFYDELKSKCPNTSFWGVGGDKLKDNGMELLYHLNDFSSWGFSEVIGKIPFYFKALNKIEEEVKRRNCKVAILIDFQDFNLRLSKKLKKLGVSVLYYVAPQAWVWKPWRAAAISQNVHTLFTIIPFERQWFRSRGVKKVKAVKHPVLTENEEVLKQLKLGLEHKDFFKETKNILLLPGSRNFEVSNLLPEFIDSINILKDSYSINVAIVESSSVDSSLYTPFDSKIHKIFKDNELSNALEWADLAVAASGTVTLSCALYEVPTVVCYKVSLFNEFIFYSFLSYSGYFSLANIIHQKQVYPELSQERVSGFNISQRLNHWLSDKQAYIENKNELAQTKHLIKGDDFVVGDYIAKIIQELYHV